MPNISAHDKLIMFATCSGGQCVRTNFVINSCTKQYNNNIEINTPVYIYIYLPHRPVHFTCWAKVTIFPMQNVVRDNEINTNYLLL